MNYECATIKCEGQRPWLTFLRIQGMFNMLMSSSTKLKIRMALIAHADYVSLIYHNSDFYETI